MIEKKTYETPLGIKRTFFYDSDRLTEYRRIVGGVAWPVGERPGFVTVIAEDDHKNPRLKLRCYRLLDEYENINPERIIKKLFDFQNKYLVNIWYGDDRDILMSNFIDNFNNSLTKKQKGIYIAEAPFCDDSHNLRMYANQIKERMVSVKKALFFGETSKLPGALIALTPDDVAKKRAQEFPIIAALGFTIAGLDEPYIEVGEERDLFEQYRQKVYAEGL